MPAIGGAGNGSPAANQFPSTSPQNAAIYLNTHFQGDNGQPGGTVAALQEPGASLGAQWLSWYMKTHAKYGNAATLAQYEEAFILIWEDVKNGQNIATATAGGLSAAGGFVAAGVAIGSSASQGLNMAAPGLGLISSPLEFFSSSQFWTRAGQVALGLVLIAVGMVKLAETSPLARSVVNQVPAVKAVRRIVK